MKPAHEHVAPDDDHLWDVAALKHTPDHRWLTPPARQTVGEVLYVNEPYRGTPTEVYAKVMLPDLAFEPDGHPVPAMVLVHGGGGRAFEPWVLEWAARGYATIAMDLSGRGADPAVRLPNGGPDQSHEEKFFNIRHGLREVWSYHAVAAIMRATSLIASLPAVDDQRIGLTGISWGGHLACLVAGLDDRLGFVAPVYGCGFIREISCWAPSPSNSEAIRLDEDEWVAWDRHFDPRHFLSNAMMPMLFVNGTNDFAYATESWQKTTDLPRGPVQRCLRVGLMHGHEAGWAPPEIEVAANAALRGGVGLPTLGRIVVDGQRVCAAASASDGSEPIYSVLHVADADQHWVGRTWTSVPASVSADGIEACIPDDAPAHSVVFINSYVAYGCISSSPLSLD